LLQDLHGAKLLQDSGAVKLLSSIESPSPPVSFLMLSRLGTLAKIVVALLIPPPASATEKLKDVLAIEPCVRESLGGIVINTKVEWRHTTRIVSGASQSWRAKCARGGKTCTTHDRYTLTACTDSSYAT
jgi:hypothetical protein